MESASILLAVGETTAQALGIPFAASLASEIAKSCEDVAKDKVNESAFFWSHFLLNEPYQKNAKLLGVKSLRLITALEEAEALEGSKMQERIDEVVG
jgi:hypothetical protein